MIGEILLNCRCCMNEVTGNVATCNNVVKIYLQDICGVYGTNVNKNK